MLYETHAIRHDTTQRHVVNLDRQPFALRWILACVAHARHGNSLIRSCGRQVAAWKCAAPAASRDVAVCRMCSAVNGGRERLVASIGIPTLSGSPQQLVHV